jgi:TP901 family phage tail tape measure protein
MTFRLNAEIVIGGPSAANVAALKRDIQSRVSGVSSTVSVRTNPREIQNLQNLRRSLNQVSLTSKSAGEDLEEFGRRIGIAGKRYLAFSVATVGVVKALGAFRDGLKRATDFEKEIIKIGQVSQRTLEQLSGLRSEILKTASSFGVGSNEIAEAAVTLAQTGRPLKAIREDLKALAQASLAPTFGNSKDTVEGLIAVQRQFGNSAGNTIEILSKLNAVAGQFPVESSDLITAVKKTGGAFKAAGGDLDELLALFTAVRSTTRESADTIGTAFRTITGRLGRIKTINFFKDVLDVDLIKSGEILKPFEAIKAIADGITNKGISQRSPIFSQIVEELGGIRQRSKVIPLLTNIAEAEKVLNVSRAAGTSITKDAELAQEGLGNQVVKVKEEFQSFVDNVLKDPVFRQLSVDILGIAKSLIRVADATRPLIPLLATIGGAFAIRSAVPLVRGILPTLPKIKKFSHGGVHSGTGKIPGVGSRDTELIAGMPGEYIIKKSSVLKYGTDFLDEVNSGQIVKFADGGSIGPARVGTSKGQSLDTLHKRLRNLIILARERERKVNFDTSGDESFNKIFGRIKELEKARMSFSTEKNPIEPFRAGVVPKPMDFSVLRKKHFSGTGVGSESIDGADYLLGERSHSVNDQISISKLASRKKLKEEAEKIEVQRNKIRGLRNFDSLGQTPEQRLQKAAERRKQTAERKKIAVEKRGIISNPQSFGIGVKNFSGGSGLDLLGAEQSKPDLSFLRTKKERRDTTPIGSFKGFQSAFEGLARKLGVSIDDVISGFQDLTATQREQVQQSTGIVPNAAFNPRTKRVSTNVATATRGSALEELIHAQDLNLGGGNKYASAIAGTLQSAVVDKFLPVVRDEVEALADKRGLIGDKRAKFVSQRTSPQEVFTSAVRRQSQPVQAALLKRGPLLSQPDNISQNEIAKQLASIGKKDIAALKGIRLNRAKEFKKFGLTEDDLQISSGGGLTNKTKRDFASGQLPISSGVKGFFGGFSSGFSSNGKNLPELKKDRRPAPRDKRSVEQFADNSALARASFGDLSKQKSNQFGGFNLNQNTALAGGAVLGGAVVAGGLFDNEELQKTAASIGAVGFQFSLLNTTLNNGKKILKTREGLEKTNAKFQKASQVSQLLGVEVQQRGDLVGGIQSAIGSNLSEKDQAVKSLAEQQDILKTASENRDKLKAKNAKASIDELAANKQLIAAEEAKISTAKSLSKVETSRISKIDATNKKLNEQLAIEQRGLVVAGKKNVAAKQGVDIQKQNAKAQQNSLQRQQKTASLIAAGSALATLGGGFASDIGRERLSRGDSSGVGFSIAGGALQGAGVGGGIGGLFGPQAAAVGAVGGALVGLAASANSAAKDLANFRTEVVKSLVDASKGGFEKDGKKLDQETIDDFVSQIRGQSLKANKDNTDIGISGRFLNEAEGFLTRSIDATSGNSQSLTPEDGLRTKAISALNSDFFKNAFPKLSNAGLSIVAATGSDLSQQEKLLNQDKAIASRTSGRDIKNSVFAQAESFTGTDKDFNLKFGQLYEEAIKALNPEVFARGNTEEIAATRSVYLGFLQQKRDEARTDQAKAKALTESLTQAQIAVFDNFSEIDRFIGEVQERVASIGTNRDTLSFLATGNLAQVRGPQERLANVRDISSGTSLEQQFGVSKRQQLNSSVAGITSNFGAGGADIGRQFGDFSNSIPKIRDFITNLKGSLEVDENQLSDLTDSLTKGLGPEAKDILTRAIQDRFDASSGKLDVSNLNISAEVEALIGQFSGIEGASKQLVDVYTNQVQELRNNFAQERQLREQAFGRKVQQLDIRGDTSSIINGITGARPDFSAERGKRNLITGGLGVNQLSSNLRASNAKIVALQEQQSKTVDVGEGQKIEAALSKEIAARDRATRALEFLTDVTGRTAEAQQKLRQAEEDRLGKKSLLEQETLGTPQEKAELLKNKTNLNKLKTGDLNVGQLTQKDFKSLYDFVKQFGDAKVPGGTVSGKQAADALLFGKASVEASVVPKPTTKKEIEAAKLREEEKKLTTSFSLFGDKTFNEEPSSGTQRYRRLAVVRKKIKDLGVADPRQQNAAKIEELKNTIFAGPGGGVIDQIKAGGATAAQAAGALGASSESQADQLISVASTAFQKAFENFKADNVVIRTDKIEIAGQVAQAEANTKLAEAIAAFPDQIGIDGNMNLNVNIAGGQFLGEMEKVASQIALGIVRTELGKFADSINAPRTA